MAKMKLECDSLGIQEFEKEHAENILKMQKQAIWRKVDGTNASKTSTKQSSKGDAGKDN